VARLKEAGAITSTATVFYEKQDTAGPVKVVLVTPRMLEQLLHEIDGESRSLPPGNYRDVYQVY
jgi:hypothetical protein